MIHRIYRSHGRLLYYAREKYQKPQDSNASALYTTFMAHSVRQTDKLCVGQREQFLMIIDQHENGIKLLEAAAKTMFGNSPARSLIEAPVQVESHLYLTIQAADWIAAMKGKLFAFRTKPDEYSDWEWAERLFGQRIDSNATHSTLWRPR